MKDKLLIISYSFPPSSSPAAQRPYFFAKYLEKRGIKTIVVVPAVFDSSLGKLNEKDFTKEKFDLIHTKNLSLSALRDIKNETIIARSKKQKNTWKSKIKTFLYRSVSGLAYPDKGFVWIPFAIWSINKLLKKNNISTIYSTSPLLTNHIIALYFKIFKKIHWVVDIRDYHYIENYEFSSKLRKYFDKWFERIILRKSQASLFISESMREEYVARYPFIKDKSYAVYNGFDIKEFENKFLGDRIRETSSLIIFYAGSFYKGIRSPKPLLLALEYLIERNEIKAHDIIIKIAGNFEKSLISEIENLKAFKCIEFLGIIPRDQVLNLAVDAHLLWLIVGEKKSHYTGFPVKGYEYIGSRRPIMVFTPSGSEPEKIIKELNCGKRFSNVEEPDDIELNAKLFLQFYKDYKSGKLNNRLILNEKKMKKYTRQFQAEQLEGILQKLENTSK